MLNKFIFTDGDGSWPVMTDKAPPGLTVNFTLTRADGVAETE
jgi:hypothetical protein